MEPSFGEEEERAVTEYLRSGGWVTEHHKTREFEGAIAAYVGSKHCVVVNNGTVSLTLSALALGLTPGDEILVPNYTMIATPNSVQLFGGIPIFVDVEPDTLCLNLDLAQKAITKRTRAMILVAPNGRYPSSGIQAFENFARDNGIFLIEDAAQALGSCFPDGRHIGSAGLVGSFSFSAPKIISTGQGGAVVTDSDEIANKLRRLKDFGRAQGGNDIHDSIGYNFKFTDIQAVIGLEQLKKLPSRVIRKKNMGHLYAELLSPHSQVKFFESDIENNSPWFFDICAKRRNELADYLKHQGIGTRPMYPPLHNQNAYSQRGTFPVSQHVGENGLWLPSASTLTDDDIHRICDSIRAFYD